MAPGRKKSKGGDQQNGEGFAVSIVRPFRWEEGLIAWKLEPAVLLSCVPFSAGYFSPPPPENQPPRPPSRWTVGGVNYFENSIVVIGAFADQN